MSVSKTDAARRVGSTPTIGTLEDERSHFHREAKRRLYGVAANHTMIGKAALRDSWAG